MKRLLGKFLSADQEMHEYSSIIKYLESIAAYQQKDIEAGTLKFGDSFASEC